MCGCLTGVEPVFIFLYCVWGWFAVLFPKVCWVACFVLGVLACFAGAVALWPLCTINYSHFSFVQKKTIPIFLCGMVF